MEMKREPIMCVVPLAQSFDPSVDLLEFIRDVFEEVKSGKITAVAIATVNRDGSGSTGWQTTEGLLQRDAIVSNVARLAHRIQVELYHPETE